MAPSRLDALQQFSGRVSHALFTCRMGAKQVEGLAWLPHIYPSTSPGSKAPWSVSVALYLSVQAPPAICAEAPRQSL